MQVRNRRLIWTQIEKNMLLLIPHNVPAICSIAGR